jgi:hypothetical protein
MVLESWRINHAWDLAYCGEMCEYDPRNFIHGAKMKEKASVDRFEEKYAVILVGEENRVVNVIKSKLPRKIKEGMWLVVEFDGNNLISAEIDPEETERARKRIMEKLERLRKGEHRSEG